MILLLLFLAAAWHKLRDPRAFQAVLERYELVPAAIVRPVAWGVIATEIYLALRVPFSWRANLAAAALLLVYGLAIATNLLRGRTDLDCGCTGPAARTPVSAALVGKLLGYSVPMSVAIGLTSLYGFPGTMILSQEAAKGAGESPEEVAAIEGDILPKMIVAGFSTVTITSVIVTSIIAAGIGS